MCRSPVIALSPADGTLAGMKKPPAHRLNVKVRIAATLAMLMLAVLTLASGIRLLSPDRLAPLVIGEAAGPRLFNPLIHWRERGHHRLVVTDRERAERVIYDADTGRPLRRVAVTPVPESMGRAKRPDPALITAAADHRHGQAPSGMSPGSLALR